MQNLQKKFLIVIFSPILLVISLFWFFTIIRKRYCIRCIFKNIDINVIDSLDGYHFEELVAIMFKAKGFKVTTTPKSKDYGADIIATKRNLKIVVQTKLYYNHTVGNKAVQEVHTAKDYYGAQLATIVTNWTFSKPAIEMANKLDVKLINRNDVISIINSIKNKSKDDPLSKIVNNAKNKNYSLQN